MIQVMAEPADLLLYLRDCYRADHRGSAVLDVFADRVSHRYVFEGEERIASGKLPIVPGPAEPLLAAGRAAEVYRRERSLIYGVDFVAGQTDGCGGLPAQICAPLLLFPATVSESEQPEDTVAFVTPDLSAPAWNVTLLRGLLGGGEGDAALLEGLLSRMPEPPFEALERLDLMHLLRDALPGLGARDAFLDGELTEGKVLRSAARGALRFVAAAVLALVPNAHIERGVVFDLERMASSPSLSTPVLTLLGHPPLRATTPGESPPPVRVPAVLSHAQQAAVASAREQPLTLVVGPPGTGKSYTMAAVALDHLARGRSVLIAARMRHALDVVERKVETLIGTEDFMIRGGRGQQIRDLKRHLERLLTGNAPRPETDDVIEDLRGRHGRLESEREHLEAQMAHVTDVERTRGDLLSGPPPDGLFARFGAGVRLQLAAWRLTRAGVPWELLDRYEAVLEERTAVVAHILRHTVWDRVWFALAAHRKELKGFLSALRARTSSRQAERFAALDLAPLLQAFPLWLSTFGDAYQVLPFEQELFDLVLVDEATQCDMASCLPIAQRGKRLLVTGDPKQLRHVSFLARAQQRLLADGHGLTDAQREAFDYRDASLLDRVDDGVAEQSQVVFLDEHFRGTPDLIQFSNDEFYAGALHVMTERPDTAGLVSIAVHEVEGRREPEGHNPIEAEAVLAAVAELVAEDRDVPGPGARSIGILSPFRAQVDLLQAEVTERFPLDVIRRHDIQVGTSYSFQGEERDVMFVSFALDPDAHSASLRYLCRPDVFNVAITRARRFQHVYVSRPRASVPADTLLRRYLDRAEATRVGAPATDTTSHDAALRHVAEVLAEEGLRVWTAYPVAGLPVDVVVEQAGTSLGIDLIGFPGPFGLAFDLERYRMFRRAGFAVFPLPWSRWQEDRAGCVAEIRERLGDATAGPTAPSS